MSALQARPAARRPAIAILFELLRGCRSQAANLVAQYLQRCSMGWLPWSRASDTRSGGSHSPERSAVADQEKAFSVVGMHRC